MLNQSDVYKDNNARQINIENASDLVNLHDVNLFTQSKADASRSNDHVLRVKEFINRHTYIEYQSNDWKQKLLYAMPLNPIHGDYPRYNNKKPNKEYQISSF